MASLLTSLCTRKRIYVATKYGEPVVARLKALGAHWDPAHKAWWIGAAKRAEVEALLAAYGNPAAVPTEGSAAVAVSVGLSADAPAGVVADKLEEAGKVKEAERVRQGQAAQRPADEVRLTGKGTYQGRTYYLGARTKDGQRVLILGLPRPDGSYFERWVPAAEVTVTKEYQPRQVWDGRRYSGRTVTKYQTLGGIARFLRDQKNPATRRGCCTECGSYGPCGQPCSECGGEGSYA